MIHGALHIIHELSSPVHASLFIKKKIHFLPVTISPKGQRKPQHNCTEETGIFAKSKQTTSPKNKKVEKSQQEQPTSVGCKMTKRKANEHPGRGPAIAKNCNLEFGTKGTFTAKHMS